MRIPSLLLLLMLSGCNSVQKQAVQACEVFIREGLRSPSTYQRASVDDLGPAFEHEGRRVKMITVEYDAANAYGTPVRGSQQCVFEVNDKGAFVDDLEHAARMASIGSDSEYSPCCLLDKSEKLPRAASDDVGREADEALNAADAALDAAAATLQEPAE
jgi:hypothetical protein